MQLIKRKGLYENQKISFIPVDLIFPNPAQPRRYFDPKALSELSDSIKQYGVLQPLTVRRLGRNFELVAGERRLRASRLAGLSEVPCIILGIDSEQSSLIAIVENLQRQDLDYIEEAEGLLQLMSLYGLSQEEAAKRVNKSQSAVANKLRILKLPPEILYTLREAGLSERHARALLRIPDDRDKIVVLEHIIKKGLTVAKTDEYVEYFLASKKEGTPRKKARPHYILKDVRFFLNTVDRGMDMMKRSGIHAQYDKSETESDIILTVTIPKSKA